MPTKTKPAPAPLDAVPWDEEEKPAAEEAPAPAPAPEVQPSPELMRALDTIENLPPAPTRPRARWEDLMPQDTPMLREAREAIDLIERAGSPEECFPRTPLEGRAGVQSLAQLHHERRALVAQIAPLDALFSGGGQGGTPADSLRKSFRYLLMTEIAVEQGITGDKQESRLERLASADPRLAHMTRWLGEQRTDFALLKDRIRQVDELIRDREEALRAYRSEVNANIGGGGGA